MPATANASCTWECSQFRKFLSVCNKYGKCLFYSDEAGHPSTIWHMVNVFHWIIRLLVCVGDTQSQLSEFVLAFWLLSVYSTRWPGNNSVNLEVCHAWLQARYLYLITLLHLKPPLGMTPVEFHNGVYYKKNQTDGAAGLLKDFDNMFSHCDITPVYYMNRWTKMCFRILISCNA